MIKLVGSVIIFYAVRTKDYRFNSELSKVLDNNFAKFFDYVIKLCTINTMVLLLICNESLQIACKAV
jgi:hypothetical protein